ncbi:MAG: hypothetical protein IJA83_06900 [Clostridia bacterium]|nr:hypothetical protein [Clostridia bacterium]
MKKFLATLLALTLLLGMAAPALAEDTVSYYIRGGGAEHDKTLMMDMVGLQKIAEIAGVTIDWTDEGKIVCGSNEEIDQAYLAYMAGGQYADILQWGHNDAYVGGVTKMYADGIIIELNDVIDKYMPNLKAILEANPELANDLKNDDGQFLYFTTLNGMNTIEDVIGVTWWGPMLRKDWLENVGAEVPTTIEEWYDVLTLFKEGDPNGNGELDEIPLDGGAGAHMLFMGAYDIMSGIYVDPITGKVGYGEYSDGYKAWLETMNKWYSEGLMQNVFVDETGAITDGATVDENLYADLIGSWKGLSNYWEQRLPNLLTKNPNADFVAAPWVKDANGSVYSGYEAFGRLGTNLVCISTDCDNVEAAARLIDTMYSEAGSILMTWGVEATEKDADGNWINGNWAYDENGKKYTVPWTWENVEYRGSIFPRHFTYAMAHANFPRFGQSDYNATSYSEMYVGASKIWADSDFSMTYPSAIALPVEEQAEVTTLSEDMAAYIAEMQYKFITGAEPLTNYDAYLEQLQKMGIETIIGYYQAAYDRYVARAAE